MSEKEKERIALVLDSSSFIGGFNPQFVDLEQYTIPEVLDEVKSRTAKFLLEVGLSSGRVKILAPSDAYVEKVKKKAMKSGDFWKLDSTDLKLLALALELKEEFSIKPIVVSDDYSVQNVAKLLSIEYLPVVYAGIKKIFVWKIYCPNCKRQYPPDFKGDTCPECGSRLRRKVVRQKESER